MSEGGHKLAIRTICLYCLAILFHKGLSLLSYRMGQNRKVTAESNLVICDTTLLDDEWNAPLSFIGAYNGDPLLSSDSASRFGPQVRVVTDNPGKSNFET